MNLIQRVTSNPLQRQTLILDDGSRVTFTLYFVPMQQCWVIRELTWGESFVIRGLRVCNSPNLLFQWKNLLPFGLGCFSDDNREPALQEDFSSGASKLYILTEAEVREYAEFVDDGN